jgi:hypothetical protein
VSENGPARPESEGAGPVPKTRTWVLVVPFLPLTTAQKIGLSSGLVVVAEMIFWVAALFVGREAISRYRRYFDPRAWFRKR